MKSTLSAILLAVPVIFCTGLVWKNPCRGDSVRLQKVSRTQPTPLVFEGKSVISAVDHAFVYNTGYKRITVLKTTPESYRFIQSVVGGNCNTVMKAVVIPDPGNPYREVFRIVPQK